MNDNDISEMLKAYNEGLMTSSFEHYEFVSKLAGYIKEIKGYYNDIHNLRCELDIAGMLVDNTKTIRMLDRRIDILNDLISDMIINFIDQNQ